MCLVGLTKDSFGMGRVLAFWVMRNNRKKQKSRNESAGGSNSKSEIVSRAEKSVGRSGLQIKASSSRSLSSLFGGSGKTEPRKNQTSFGLTRTSEEKAKSEVGSGKTYKKTSKKNRSQKSTTKDDRQVSRKEEDLVGRKSKRKSGGKYRENHENQNSRGVSKSSSASTSPRGTPSPKQGTESPRRSAGKYQMPVKPSAEKPQAGRKDLLIGTIKRHPDGFGFLLCDDKAYPDVYVPRQYMSAVMTNDKVEVRVYKKDSQDRLAGEITRVISRAHQRIVGRYLPVDLKYGVILDEGRGWGADLRIAAADSGGAKEGDMVAVDVLTYPSETDDFTGRVVQILGDADDPINDVKRMIFHHHIPHEFSQNALRDARKWGTEVRPEDIAGRVDLREKSLITIDGATARDFDDAIYVEQTPSGFKLWVAIADVSHYVIAETALDIEAFERGTSTYFPNYVVPMLPEELSNELCSLKPHVVRLCFVCEMQISFEGEIQSKKFYEAVMESKARVTYGEAQEAIDGNPPEKIKHVAEHIRAAAGLAKILMAKRFREGSLDLEIPETQVVVDPSGNTTDIIKTERLFAHRLIEELMLAANISVAEFLDEKQVPALYRVHEPPMDENLKSLERFLFNFGGPRSLEGGKLQKKITRALESFAGKPEATILNILTLRSMNQAKYSPENVGHFGLGFSHYAHFTSPIRRYPDLIVHRLTKSVLYPKYNRDKLRIEELETAGVMLSACEQRSAKAERQLISIKKARFIKQFVGSEFEGMVSSVTKFGIFVQLRAYDVDGLIKIERLGNDRFEFDQQNLRLVGKRTGQSFSLGDILKVRVVAADPEAGKVDFELVGVEIESSKGSDENRKYVQKRGKTENNRGRVRKERVSKRRRKN